MANGVLARKNTDSGMVLKRLSCNIAIIGHLCP